MLCKNFPSEAERKTKFPLPDSWPNGGRIEFQNYSTGYNHDSNLSLKNINCTITESEKVGIVGRTGAGKSSLSLALFRIIEAFSGKILIDKIDISVIGLHDLRTRMAIVPQVVSHKFFISYTDFCIVLLFRIQYCFLVQFA